MITQQKIHYARASIRNWTTETARLTVNWDVVGTTTNKIHKLQWKMTQEKRELWNGLQDAEDDGWSTYTTAYELWNDIRKEYGHQVKLWVGKLHQRARFVPGKVQNNTRVPYAVSILCLHRQTQQLIQYTYWDDWHHTQEFHDIEGADYNRVWDYRNPTSSKANTPQTKRIEL